MNKLNRRELLGVMGGVAVGSVAASVLTFPRDAYAGIEPETDGFSWKPQSIDPKEAALTAHQAFYNKGKNFGGCAYGSFYGIIGLLGKKYGDPYKSFPFSMMDAGKGGIANYGTLCGSLMGAVCALGLFWEAKDRDPLAYELFRWYETTAFPLYKPATDSPVGFTGTIPTSVSGSVLCHISVSKWAMSNKLPAMGKERAERCARLTADVAAKTAELISAKVAGSFKAVFAPSETDKYCGNCHGEDPKKFSSPYMKGKMDCQPCHTGSKAVMNKTKNHP